MHTKPLPDKAKTDSVPADPLSTVVAEPKRSKGGLVAFLFRSGNATEGIAAELKAAFKLTDEQAVKIVRASPAGQGFSSEWPISLP